MCSSDLVAIDLANAINLLDGDYWPLLKTAYTNVPADIRQVGPGFRYLGGDIPPEVGWNYRDCMAVNAFVEALEQEGIPCDVIVAAFAEGEPLDCGFRREAVRHSDQYPATVPI